MKLGYGVLPDFTLRGIPRRLGRMPARPFAVSWSPDGRYAAGIRYDERALQDYPYLESSPTHSARPRVHTVKLGVLGDAQQVCDSLYVIDIPSGRQHDIALPEGWNTLSEAGILGWDGDRLYAVIAHFGTPRRLRLVEIDANSGALRTVVEEASDTRLQLNVYSYNRPAVAILPGQDTAVWFSQRDGWEPSVPVRLSDGRCCASSPAANGWCVTCWVWTLRVAGRTSAPVASTVATRARPVPGIAAGRSDPAPGADGNDHMADAGTGAVRGRAPQALSPGGGYLVDTVSRLDQPPRTVLRASDDGREVMVLETADDSAIVAAGWRAPRRERLLAPMDARRSSPPSTCPATIAMMAASGDRRDVRWFLHQQCAGDLRRGGVCPESVSRASLAELGFMVVSIDARGTGGRNKAFHDSSFLRAADVQLDDHVARCASWANATRASTWSRVGIYGHSFGGYSAARALLRYPRSTRWAWPRLATTISRVCTAAPCGMDRLFGGVLPATPNAEGVPAPFAGLDNAALAGNLRGHLLLVYGELDENAPPALTLQLAPPEQGPRPAVPGPAGPRTVPQRRHLHAPHVGLLRAPPGRPAATGYGAGAAGRAEQAHTGCRSTTPWFVGYGRPCMRHGPSGGRQ